MWINGDKRPSPTASRKHAGRNANGFTLSAPSPLRKPVKEDVCVDAVDHDPQIVRRHIPPAAVSPTFVFRTGRNRIVGCRLNLGPLPCLTLPTPFRRLQSVDGRAAAPTD